MLAVIGDILIGVLLFLIWALLAARYQGKAREDKRPYQRYRDMDDDFEDMNPGAADFHYERGDVD